MKRKILAIIIVIIGLGLTFYPWISNYMYERSTGSEIKAYQKKVKNITKEQYEHMLKIAKEYNESLAKSNVVFSDPFKAQIITEDHSTYEKILEIGNDGMMAYLEIPSIGVELPIYHGTDAATLEKGVGHLEGSSLPIGGKSTHAVLTGHTGLSSAKIFTDLIEMEKGDLFYISVCGKNLAYRVDQISVVEPEDTKKLDIVKGKDYVTLVTCTPYGVNSHRLLVRGHRTKYDQNEKDNIKKHIGSQWMGTYLKALIIGISIILFIALIVLVVRRRKRKKCGK